MTSLPDVIPDEDTSFETKCRIFEKIIAIILGYIRHELQRCLEKPSRHLLLARWQTSEAHTIGFRCLLNTGSEKDCSITYMILSRW